MNSEAPVAIDVLPDLYEADETAWLDEMALRIQQGRLEELDYAHLVGYLSDMAASDRRRVKSRLTVLLAHVLKWIHQPAKRTPSWRATILEQRRKVRDDTESGVLQNHAHAVLSKAYADAVEQAAAETELPISSFPTECPFTLDQLLSMDLLAK